MFDSFAGTIGLVVIALMEMTAVIYVYGHEKYVEVHCVTFAIILDSLRTQIYGFYAILGLAMIFIKWPAIILASIGNGRGDILGHS